MSERSDCLLQKTFHYSQPYRKVFLRKTNLKWYWFLVYMKLSMRHRNENIRLHCQILLNNLNLNNLPVENVFFFAKKSAFRVNLTIDRDVSVKFNSDNYQFFKFVKFMFFI